MSEHIDKIETMLAHFMYANAKEDTSLFSHQNKSLYSEGDAGIRLRFQPTYPSNAITADMGNERLFATDPRLLLAPAQELLGSFTEVALVAPDQIKWAAFRKISKRPRGVWVAKPGADLYEFHSRFIRPDGSSDYAKRVAAIDKAGNPVRVIIEGTSNQNGSEPNFLVMAASIVEDLYRPSVFRATVSAGVAVTLPIEQGEHLDVFKLRDGPETEGGRRRPLLHWVAKHLRKTKRSEQIVKAHLRGIHEFEIEGLRVRLQGDPELTTTDHCAAAIRSRT